MLRVFVIIALVLVLYFLVKGLLRPSRRDRGTKRTHPNVGRTKDNELVKDPSCGTYIPLDTALQARIDGETLYFCSKECMKRHLERNRGRS